MINKKRRRPYYRFDSTKYLYVYVHIEKRFSLSVCLLLLLLFLLLFTLFVTPVTYTLPCAFFCSFALYQRNKERINITKDIYEFRFLVVLGKYTFDDEAEKMISGSFC
jgi:hypothetical protein